VKEGYGWGLGKQQEAPAAKRKAVLYEGQMFSTFRLPWPSGSAAEQKAQGKEKETGRPV